MLNTEKILSVIDRISEWTGKAISLLWLPLIGVIVYSVIMRYVFNKAPQGADEVAGWLWGIAWIVGGAYAYFLGAHVKMDTIYNRLSIRGRAIADLFTAPIFYAFVIALMWKTVVYAWDSVAIHEHAATMWSPPIYPIKVFIPLGVFLLLLQGLAKTVRDVIILTTKKNRHYG